MGSSDHEASNASIPHEFFNRVLQNLSGWDSIPISDLVHTVVYGLAYMCHSTGVHAYYL